LRGRADFDWRRAGGFDDLGRCLLGGFGGSLALGSELFAEVFAKTAYNGWFDRR
jgi:hypothetical protein